MADFKKIAQKAVDEAAEELKKDTDAGKVDEAIKTIDAVNMVAEVVENAIKDTGQDPEKISEEVLDQIAKNSAKAAISEGVKSLG